MNIEQLYQIYLQTELIDTDTRKIRKGSLFFALKGDNFNGNQFALEALNKGAFYAIIDDSEFFIDHRTILVTNVLETLQKLANYHRRQLTIPVIALTGSNGKTTTKELINAVLSSKFNTTATVGNLNNHIGVPLTLLSINLKTEFAIVEMGANHKKEIELLSAIAEPDFGYITNFGKAHLEGFGGIEGVIEGKTELYTYLLNNNKTVFINENDAIQVEKSKGIKSVYFNNQKVEFIEANPFVTVQFKNEIIKSKLIGKYNYPNIAIAITIGNYFGVEVDKIKKAIEKYTPSNNRSQILQIHNLKILLDAYNANPSSMQAALENFSQLTNPKKIVILGDMFELGETSLYEHQKIAELAYSCNFSQLHLIGKAFSTVTVKNAFLYDNFDVFKGTFNKENYSNAILLIKGSRGMALERILPLLN